MKVKLQVGGDFLRVWYRDDEEDFIGFTLTKGMIVPSFRNYYPCVTSPELYSFKEIQQDVSWWRRNIILSPFREATFELVGELPEQVRSKVRLVEEAELVPVLICDVQNKWGTLVEQADVLLVASDLGLGKWLLLDRCKIGEHRG